MRLKCASWPESMMALMATVRREINHTYRRVIGNGLSTTLVRQAGMDVSDDGHCLVPSISSRVPDDSGR